MTPSGTRGVVKDALSIYFGDATPASAFVAGRCVGATADMAGGSSGFGFGTMSPSRGSGRDCIEPRER